MNFVTETETNLSGSKRHLTIVVVKKSSEVDENTLSCLWAEETSLSAGGPDLSLEHEIERKGL